MASVLYQSHREYSKYQEYKYPKYKYSTKENKTLTINKNQLINSYHSRLKSTLTPLKSIQLNKSNSSILSNQILSEEEESDSTIDQIGFGCNICGKVYKHSNCLTKHQWEHTEHWEYTSKFSLKKHQKVQMLEAASILLNMKSKRKHYTLTT